MNNNLPAGAAMDSRAPWNIDRKLCCYCDKEEITEVFFEEVTDEEFDETKLEEFISEHQMCKDCYKEEMADWDED
jgi:hypothetical protein